MEKITYRGATIKHDSGVVSYKGIVYESFELAFRVIDKEIENDIPTNAPLSRVFVLKENGDLVEGHVQGKDSKGVWWVELDSEDDFYGNKVEEEFDKVYRYSKAINCQEFHKAAYDLRFAESTFRNAVEKYAKLRSRLEVITEP